MDLRDGRFISPETPATQVFFDKATPTTGGVVFDPNTPATVDVLYVSSTNASTWVYQDGSYVTYTAPTVDNTEWYINGTTIDAGSNKTASIQRSGAIHVTADSFFNGVQIGMGNNNINTNTITGSSSGTVITSGGFNSFFGKQAGQSNTTGLQNTFLGYFTGQVNISGGYNVAVGSTAGKSNTGSYNVYLGQGAGGNQTSGSQNVFLGRYSGWFIADGVTLNTVSSNSVFLGNQIRSLADNQTNQIIIGDSVIGKGSNTVQIGNTSVTDTYLQGAVTFNNAYKFPTTDGTANQVLKTNGSGTLSWAAGASSGVCGIANSSGVYTYYSTLNAAITAATSGQTVDLLTDITETGSVTITTKAGVKINGNGYTYTLNVNDGTHAITQVGQPTEISNLKVVRTGRTANASGIVFYTNTSVNAILKCSNVEFVNDYGVAVSLNRGTIYGLKVNSYGTCITTGYEYGYIYDCNLTSTASMGYDNTYNSGEVSNCVVNASLTAIMAQGGTVYNSIGRSSTGVGIQANTRVVNSTGTSSTGAGISSPNGYNCVGISTTGVGLSGTFTNSTGISTSGYAGSGGTKTNCTLISSSNYASFQENLNNCYLESTTNVPLWLNTGKLINGCTALSLWNNVGGHAINTTAAATGVDIRNSSLTVTNASAYCINGAAASTFKYANNSFKGATVAVNATNVAQGITNLSDTKGNILI
jgi:hypothetical protein